MVWNFRRVLLLTGTVVALALAVWLVGRPAYRGWREQLSLAQARKFFADADLRSAVLATRQALALNPNNPEACRLMGHITELLRAPSALAWRRRVTELQPGDFTNQVQLARTAILLGNFSSATAALEAIPAAQRDHPAFHQLSAMLALAQNNLPSAGQHLTEAARLDPDNKRIQLNLAVLDLQSTNAPLTEAALRSLRELGAVPELRADALRQLALNALLRTNRSEAISLTQELQSFTNAPMDDRLLHLRAWHSPDTRVEFARCLTQLQAHCQTVTNGFGELALWLLQHGMAEEAARWLAALPTEFRQRLEIKIVRADCNVTLKDWRGLEQLLQEDTWEESEFMRHALLARARRELGGEIGAQAQWGNAIRSSQEQARKLVVLARLTVAWNWQREHEEVLWLLLHRHPAERWVADALNRTLLRSGNTLGLQKLYEELVTREPENLPARNNLAVVCLLLNLQMERAHELARSTYLRAATNATFASTYAYSLYLQGRAADGLAVLDSFPRAATELPSIALYHGVLQSSVAPEKASPLLDLAEKASLLLPEERALLREARQRLP